MDETMTKIYSIINKIVGRTLDSYDNLLEKKIFDSLMILQIVSSLENEFTIRIPADEFLTDNFNNPDNICALVNRLRK